MRVLEFFCGIGGCAAACPPSWEIVSAIDVNDWALQVYHANFAHPLRRQGVEHLPMDWLARCRADLWWYSPPCQPFTVRGRQLDLHDPRARVFPAMLQQVCTVRPHYVGLENVQGFARSRARSLWVDGLRAIGYSVAETLLCPTQLGIPARRPRWYVMASQSPLPEIRITPTVESIPRGLGTYFDRSDPEQWLVPPYWLDSYGGSLHVVHGDAVGSTCRCFTSAYGKSPVRSGSYVASPRGVRFCQPREILNLLGFAASYVVPQHLSRRQAWSLIGNSLSVPAVRQVLKWLTGVA